MSNEVSGKVELDDLPFEADLYLIDLTQVPTVKSDPVTGAYVFQDPGDHSVIPDSDRLMVLCDYGAGIRPLAHGPIVPAAVVEPTTYYDQFENTLDTEKWVVYSNKGTPENAYTANGKLNLKAVVGQNPVCIAAMTTQAVATTGTLTIRCKWTPGPHHLSAYGVPYISICPVSLTRNSVYGFVASALSLGLSSQNDSTSRSAVGFSTGIYLNAENCFVTASGTWEQATEYALEIIVNWDVSTVALSIDGSEAIAATAFNYTPSGEHRIEFGNSTYAGTEMIERFDDIEIVEA